MNSVNVDMVVAVVDRAGFVLGVFRTQNAPAVTTGNFGQPVDANDLAVALARTRAFFSNDQAPLSSRTVRFISGIHFPPGVANQPSADLYGIENTNRGCTLVNDANFESKVPPSLTLSGGFGPGVVTGKADINDTNATAVNPGGVPIFYKHVVIGGVGVVTAASNANVAEFAAFTGSTAARTGPTDSFGPTPAAPGVVFHRWGRVAFRESDFASSGILRRAGRWHGEFSDLANKQPGATARRRLDRARGGTTWGIERARRKADSRQCRNNREHHARGDPPPDRFTDENGDRGCGSGWNHHRIAAHARFHGL